MLCKACGRELPEDARFCPVCGERAALEQGRITEAEQEACGQEAAGLSAMPEDTIVVRRLLPDSAACSAAPVIAPVKRKKKIGTLLVAVFLTTILTAAITIAAVYFLMMQKELESFEQAVLQYERELQGYELGTKRESYDFVLAKCREVTPDGRRVDLDILDVRKVNYLRIGELRRELENARVSARALNEGLQELIGSRGRYAALLREGKIAGEDLEQGNKLLESLDADIAAGDTEEGTKEAAALEALGGEITKKREDIARYWKKYEDKFANTEEYILSLVDQKVLEGLKEQFQAAMESVDPETCGILELKLNALLEEGAAESRRIVEEEQIEVKAMDLQKAYPAEISLVKGYSDEVSVLLQENKYNSAHKVLEKWRMLSEAVSGNGKVVMEFGQLDASAYPRVKIYLSIREKASGQAVEIRDFLPFSMAEQTGDSGSYEGQSIRTAERAGTGQPQNIGLVADVSKSMDGSPIFVAKTLLNDFMAEVLDAGENKIALLAFAEKVNWEVGFTSDEEKLSQAVNGLITGKEQGRLYDALYSAIGETARQSGIKCVIAYTDSEDTASQCTPEAVEELAKRYQIPLYIVGAGKQKDSDRLDALCRATGGFYENVDDIVQMGEIYRSIYQKNQEMYLLEYETGLSQMETKKRKIYINYIGEELVFRGEHAFVPSVYREGNQSQGKLFYKDCIIYDSDSRYLTAADLKQLTTGERELAGYEIYARRGMRFDKDELQKYFDSKPWYEGSTKEEAFEEGILNRYERANAYFIEEFEALTAAGGGMEE